MSTKDTGHDYRLYVYAAQDVLKGAVGMRNAIVHDYLDLDWSKIEAVIKQGQYRQVSIYVHHLCQNLLETGER